mmetsp:Transcript_26968/g.67784  ORF Transcript_26968/g.67784 Transcript_26968/m.67784 type:complete len:484 (+) Transcript_26968:161-1612(+)|eukprot:CAMPEP_0174239042 /NCGR_PEP_ID=MMETSP0417-20130205/13275_1 /TAXON_ID=242541 /ORGANISM="Mayorella sp, Strain BSH-02190019" /LENGTH=483 /DNA_ID=CAMNT_0015317943 /DNA_START=74 /DNA_END=1525 /DNA_ORIENTATION=+
MMVGASLRGHMKHLPAAVHRSRSSSSSYSSLRSSSSTECSSSPSLAAPVQPLSVYVHFPYCQHICGYCAFTKYPARLGIDHERFRGALLREARTQLALAQPLNRVQPGALVSSSLSSAASRPPYGHLAAAAEHRAPGSELPRIHSVFFGGGTPSLAEPRLVSDLLQCLRTNAQLEEKVEVTMEMNPTSIEVEKLHAFREAGVNRVSIGVQALNAEDLVFLGRKHSVQEAVHAIRSAQKIFPLSSIDLIFGRHAKQELSGWRDELHFALGELGLRHLSLYELSIEEGTSFDRLKKHNRLSLCDDEISAELYDACVEVAAEYGLERYEVSNFAVPGEECVHNVQYWCGGDFLGLGPSASGRIHLSTTPPDSASASMQQRAATKNHASMQEWYERVERDGTAFEQIQFLDPSEQRQELLMMGLRRREGISTEVFRQHSGESLHQFVTQSDGVQWCIEEQLLRYDASGLRASPTGMNLLNSVLDRIL